MAQHENHVKFIKYTGTYPCLCCGVLTLRIDGNIVRFSGESDNCFWTSGGCAYFDDDGKSHVTVKDWIIFESKIPDKYYKYKDEIINAFIGNVPNGCCGGCL